MTKFACLLIAICLLYACRHHDSQQPDYSGWTSYAGSKDGIRYSSDTSFTANNVRQLQVAWVYSSGDADTGRRSQNQCNPIMVDSVLYGVTPSLKLFALNAATGQPYWLFDPASEDTSANKDPFAFFKVTRGVMYWQSKDGTDKRVLYNAGSKTYAINAKDGKPVRSFGNNGYIDLSQNLGRDSGTYNPFIVSSTPGIIYKDVLIMGSRVAETADGAPGHIRAYDLTSGQLKWVFHTIPHPGEKYYDTWPDSNAWKKLGGANNWAGMALDEGRGIVYIPLGSISGDFYGGFRKGQNLYANSLLALNATTGEYIWHYQTVHHDLWDRDLPANPNLVTIKKDGKTIDAVAQITKQGNIFLFDRTNGTPVFPIEEKPFPASELPGEETWPTQPIPTLPEPFAPQIITENDLTDRTPEAHAEMLEQFRSIKYHQPFDPPSKGSSILYPGYDGGGEWGGSAVDPESGILYVNSNQTASILTLVDVDYSIANTLAGRGKQLYGRFCLNCHGPELKGNGASFPSLIDIHKKYKADEVDKIITNGRNMMPSFKFLNPEDKKAILSFLLHLQESTAKNKSEKPDKEPGTKAGSVLPPNSIMNEVPYQMTGYIKFMDKDGYPGTKPPWGTLNAVDLNTGKLLWKVPLGNDTTVWKPGQPATGTEGYGGPLVTKGGLVFIANSKDAKMHAFNKKTGKLLWEASLPAPGYATPATYVLKGKQYVVIACGGGKIGSKSGDKYVAFALPD